MPTLSTATLSALYLPRAHFALRHDGQYFVATFKARPGSQWVCLEVERPSGQAALDALDVLVRAALEPDGDLGRYVR